MPDTLLDREDLIRQGFRSQYIPHLLGSGIKDEDGKEWWSQQLVNNVIRTVILPAYTTALMVDHKRIWNIDFDANTTTRWETIRDAAKEFQWDEGSRPVDPEQDKKEQLSVDAGTATLAALMEEVASGK
jgi:hypothetical protein